MTLEYIRLTKDFEEIKEYVRHKGDTLTGYRQTKEKVSVRIEDILYFETVDGLVFAYTVDCVYEIKGRLYQVEEKVNKRNICRASKTMLVNVEHIISVRTALNGRLYARMENGEEILITRRYAKEVEDCFRVCQVKCVNSFYTSFRNLVRYRVLTEIPVMVETCL